MLNAIVPRLVSCGLTDFSRRRPSILAVFKYSSISRIVNPNQSVLQPLFTATVRLTRLWQPAEQFTFGSRLDWFGTDLSSVWFAEVAYRGCAFDWLAPCSVDFREAFSSILCVGFSNIVYVILRIMISTKYVQQTRGDLGLRKKISFFFLVEFSCS